VCALQPDVVAVTETFIDQSISDAVIVPDGYTVCRHDRDPHGGGVLVLIRSLIPLLRRTELEMNCEMLWLDLHTSRGVVSFVVHYRSPGSSVDSLKLLGGALLLHSSRCLPLWRF